MWGLGNPIRSSSWEEDGLSQAAAAANRATLYTLTDYSGKGILIGLGYYNAISHSKGYIVITSDGNAHAWDADSVDLKCAEMFQGISAKYIRLQKFIEFKTSLMIQIANDEPTAQDIVGGSHYSIFSKEIRREIIPAGGALPGRDYTYDFDVMLVWFQGSYGISNKVQFLPASQMNISHDQEGYAVGQLKQFRYNTEIGAPERYILEDLKEDREEIVELDGQVYKIPLIQGAFDGRDFPDFPKKPAAQSIVDLTAE
ncbi:MAG TPA: hypothetical protein VMW42_02310 [Desulfatiglandales bacterium]|nr:hypothetical protein [Desulfatiglandales bacterium]